MKSGFSTIEFNDSKPKSSTHALEKCFENQDFIFCSSFQNLRLGWMDVRSNLQRFDAQIEYSRP